MAPANGDSRRIVVSQGVYHPFILENNGLQEINWFKSEYSSWFVGNSVISGGDIYLCTAIDPLLLAIPFLEAARNETAESPGVFQSEDQVFCQNNAIAEEAAAALQSAVESSLPLVCDSKDVSGVVYYRLSNAKLKAWLKCKVRQTVEALKEDEQYSSMDTIGLQRYGIGILSEYLSTAQTKELISCYDFPAAEAAVQPVSQQTADVHVYVTQGASVKRIRVDPKEVARRRAREAREEKREQQMRRESAGMKKMSAFFAPKAQQDT